MKPIGIELDNLIRAISKAREERCITCGVKYGLTNSHYFKRANRHFRWDIRTNHTQCIKCNGLHNSNPKPYRDWMITRYGIAGVEQMEREAHIPKKWTNEELREIKSKLQKYLMFLSKE